MSRRLPTLLRSFRLHEQASAAELRKAYLSEAKRLHPDGRTDCDAATAAQEFAELKDRFDEALGLLTTKPKGAAAASPKDPYGEWRAPAEQAARASRYAWRRSRYEWERGMPSSETGPYAGTTTAVPVVGWPSHLVYSAVGLISVLIAGLLAYKLSKAEKEALEGIQTGRLRQALELSGKSEQQRLAESFAEAEAPTAPEDGMNTPHHAARRGHIWWLERCAASPACRETLNYGDRRGDTPLHHCAMIGDSRTCCALLRGGASAGNVNRYGLFPEDIAIHAGYNDLAQLLRGIRLQTRRRPGKDSNRDVAHWSHRVRQVVARHPDGLGVMVPTPKDIMFEAKFVSESLRHAVNLAAGEQALERLVLSRSNPQDLRIAAGESVRDDIVPFPARKLFCKPVLV
eukprot:TRINITY_DN18233_c0_g1_i2.p1 TRINITY_DN18233_c0_g1~~TRINITY_DN18233_c0_g1_i2.p1  ORF type:complete len:401 (-),score=81.16 TRINITY_DN18233_c0_g1_i2:63-1265(-)